MRATVAILLVVVACMPASAPRTPTTAPETPESAPGTPAGQTKTPSAATAQPSSEPASPIAVVGDILEARSSVPRSGPDAAADDQLAEMVAADQAFAFDLYRALVESEQGNLFLSPYSISTGMSMVLAGARGQTADELASALGADPEDAAWHAARNRLELELAGLADHEPPGDGDGTPLTLETVNAIFGQAGFPFEQDFLDILAANYGAGMNTVDFANAWEAARAAINQWVAERTGDRIEELLPEGSLDNLTRAVLVNAIYFKANWFYKFDPEKTQDAPFHLLDGSTISIPAMHMEEKLQYAAGDGWQAVQLPYHGFASMLVVVPEEGRFEDVETRLGTDLLASVDSGLSEHLVDLRLPRWQSESKLDLIPPFRTLGVELLFDLDGADLTGIADVEGNLYISGVFHDSFVSVDEHGTEATAATAAVASLDSGAPAATLTVDRPFVYFIRDDANGEILFMGRLLQP